MRSQAAAAMLALAHARHRIEQPRERLFRHPDLLPGVLLDRAFEHVRRRLRGRDVAVRHGLHHERKDLVSGAVGHAVLLHEEAHHGARLRPVVVRALGHPRERNISLAGGSYADL